MDSIKNSWKYEKDLIIFNTIGVLFPIPQWLHVEGNIMTRHIVHVDNMARLKNIIIIN
mgnify:CR=1 FL=1